LKKSLFLELGNCSSASSVATGKENAGDRYAAAPRTETPPVPAQSTPPRSGTPQRPAPAPTPGSPAPAPKSSRPAEAARLLAVVSLLPAPIAPIPLQLLSHRAVLGEALPLALDGARDLFEVTADDLLVLRAGATAPGHDAVDVPAGLLSDLSTALFEVCPEGATEEAISLSRTLVPLLRHVVQRRHELKPELAARLLGVLGNAVGLLGDPREQQDHLEAALELFEAAYGREHKLVASTLINLGLACSANGQDARARSLLESALSLSKKLYGSSSSQVAMTLTNLASVLPSDTPHRVEILKRALTIEERAWGREDPRVAVTLVNLANAFGDEGDHERKAELLFRALAIEEKVYGPDHHVPAITLFNLSVALKAMGRIVEAKEKRERARRSFARYFPKNHPYIAMCR
jgi:tetratricopeptide (TPR) repeat protein